jgi:flagellar motor switch/type III secretory pathway protein FliN
MAGEHAMDLLTAAEQALASIPLPPTSGGLPSGARPVQWAELDGAPATTHVRGSTIQRSESLDLRIELGRTQICRDEARKLRTGAVLPLDNTAADPVNLYAGGQLIARGEVLAIDGALGVRVVEVISRTVRN